MQARSSQTLVDLQVQINTPGHLMDVTGENIEIESSIFRNILDGAGNIGLYSSLFAFPPRWKGKKNLAEMRRGEGKRLSFSLY